MKELLGKIGKFWIPGSPDNHVSGILHINSRNQIQLKIEMPYIHKGNNITNEKHSNWEYSSHEIILGEINTVPITLYGCFKEETRTTLNINLKANDKIIYLINYVFNKYHFNSKEDFRITHIVLQYNDLEEWVARTGFHMESMTDLFYICPPEIKATMEDFDLCVNSICSNKKNTNIKILEESVIISLTPKNKDNYFELERYILQLRDFFSFCIGRSISVKEIELVPEKNKNIPYNIEVFNNNIINSYKYDNRILRLDMFLTLQDVKKNFSTVMTNWFKQYNKLESFYYLYFINLHMSNNYLEGTLIAFTQALENYLRKTQNNDKYMGESDYQLVFENMENCLSKQEISKSHKQSLKSRIKYGNEYALRKRLTKLLKKIIKFDIIKEISANEINSFVEEIVDTRNYYTHYSEELEKKAKKGRDLLILNKKLKILIEFCFLIELGLNDDEIKNITEKYSAYKRLINENYL